jgi:DNA modification methylase
MEQTEYTENAVVLGDALAVMKTLSDESIHLTFTSPPYFNAKEYSTYPSYEAYLEFLKGIFEQVRRVTKEGRFLVVNTSPVIEPRISRAHSSKRYGIPFDLHAILVNNGWDFIDDIVWEKPAASVKNRIGGFLQHRKPLAYKPNCVTEYVMVYRKHTDNLIDWNIRQYNKETIEKSLITGDFENTNVWKINPKSSKAHPAVFPEELCKKVISYYSMQGDLILDPFAGSGTLARAAHELNRKFLLIEKNPKYYAYAKTNLRKVSETGRDA